MATDSGGDLGWFFRPVFELRLAKRRVPNEREAAKTRTHANLGAKVPSPPGTRRALSELLGCGRVKRHVSLCRLVDLAWCEKCNGA